MENEEEKYLKHFLDLLKKQEPKYEYDAEKGVKIWSFLEGSKEFAFMIRLSCEEEPVDTFALTVIDYEEKETDSECFVLSSDVGKAVWMGCLFAQHSSLETDEDFMKSRADDIRKKVCRFPKDVVYTVRKENEDVIIRCLHLWHEYIIYEYELMIPSEIFFSENWEERLENFKVPHKTIICGVCYDER